jgi:uncharacterized protein
MPAFTHPRHATLWPLVTARTGGPDLAHDADHVLRVYDWAVRIAAAEGDDADLCGAAALVHDLVNIPKESRDRPLGGERSAIAGRELLVAAGYTPDETDTCVEAVRTSSWSRGLRPTNRVGVVLQDADRLDAIGAVGIARNFATAQAMSSRGTPGRFYDPADPFGERARALDDRRNALDHWPLKLLRLEAGLHTGTARAEGARRHTFLLAFLDELRAELQGAGASGATG